MLMSILLWLQNLVAPLVVNVIYKITDTDLPTMTLITEESEAWSITESNQYEE